MSFKYDGKPQITRERILEESERIDNEFQQQKYIEEEEVHNLFVDILSVAVLGKEIQDELKDKINNILPVPESAPHIRAAVKRRSTIPQGSYIDFSLFAQAVDTVLRSRRIKPQSLVDFTGDPNVDTYEYEIKQRQNIDSDLTTVDLFLAGAVLPAAYIASRIIAAQLVGGGGSFTGAIVAEAIAFLFLLGLDRLAIKAELQKSNLNTTINGMSPGDFVDFLDDNPSEIHKILQESGISDTNKIADFVTIRDFCLEQFSRITTSEYDSWQAYHQVALQNFNLERVLEISPRYSDRWNFVRDEEFSLESYIAQGANSIRNALNRPRPNTFEERLRSNLLPMRESYKQGILFAAAQARTGYRNIISNLMNDFLPLPTIQVGDESLEGLPGLPQIALTINLNKTLLCCVLRIFSAFPPASLRLFAQILRLGAMSFQLNFRTIIGKYINATWNEYVYVVIGMIESVRNEILGSIFDVFRKDSDAIDLILACTPIQEILFQLLQQFNHLTNLLRRLLLDAYAQFDSGSDASTAWELDFPMKRTLLFIAELLDAIAIELEYSGSVLCPTRGVADNAGNGNRNQTDEVIDPDVAPQFVLNFTTDKVPRIQFSQEFLERNNLGRDIVIRDRTYRFENTEDISNEAVLTLVNSCKDELDPEKQVAIQKRIKDVIISLSKQKP